MNKRKATLIAGTTLAIAALASAQIGTIIKAGGVFLAVKQFGSQINRSINKLTGHTDTVRETSKIVPILSGGINGRTAIGMAQVMGPKAQVDKVQAVAQLDQDLFGREIKIRAMIPIESKDVIRDLKKVEGVGVTGIVDLKL